MIDKLQYFLQQPLPGEAAQLMMSPSSRQPALGDKDVCVARNSSVMILMFQNSQGDWSFPLIKRPAYAGAHSGQISLPGGKWEKDDENAWATAVRETKEEIGISVSMTYLGSLSPLYIPHSNFMVYPFVGIVDYIPEYKPDAFEVAEVFEASVPDLIEQSIRKDKSISFTHRDMNIVAPCYEVGHHIVWGATAMILSEFLEVVKKAIQLPTESSHFCNVRIVQESPSHTDKVLRRDNTQI